jgi:hypothetical protein
MSKTLKKIRKKRAKQDRETRERYVSKNSPLFINTKHNIFWLLVFMQQSSHTNSMNKAATTNIEALQKMDKGNHLTISLHPFYNFLIHDTNFIINFNFDWIKMKKKTCWKNENKNSIFMFLSHSLNIAFGLFLNFSLLMLYLSVRY